ncbi:DapH/DapD/GlmU-related protein [Micrococcus luteus]|uniref:DapH/DapD/GlmU-related protein n=1 Tax=Micrococcus luteus TaxID=1270 RepID=UPI001F3D5022|nr:DapH/DapD/GlmU-related protein [Micrococcus luteus]
MAVTPGAPIVIGDDVFVGQGATILGGATVGAGAVVGARSVVTKDVPAGPAVAGVPAQVLKNGVEHTPASREEQQS